MGNSLIDIENRVYEWCSRYKLLDHSVIVIGLSGGPDSVALLHILKRLKDTHSELKFDIKAFHVNHMLRGDNSDGDCVFSEELCSSLDIPFNSVSLDVKSFVAQSGRSLEDSARILRYEAIRKFSSEYMDSVIAVAHHSGDVAETMLMNLFRGSGLEGLVSPEAQKEDIIRPLLCISKDEILTYLSALNQDFRTDESNSINDCTRNKWRNEIIPAISEVSVKEPVKALNDSYELLSEDLGFISSYVECTYLELYTDGFLPVRELKELHPAIRSRLIRKLWADIFGNLTDFEKVNLDCFCSFIFEDGHSEKTIDMPFGRVGYKASGYCTFCNPKDVTEVSVRLANALGFIASSADISLSLGDILDKTSKLPNSDIQITASIVENNIPIEYNNLSWYFPVYDSGFNPKDINIGNMAGKDVTFKRAGTSLSQSYNHMMGNIHVPLKARDRIITVTSGKDILWFPGVGHSVGFTDEKSCLYFNTREDNPLYFVRVEIEGK